MIGIPVAYLRLYERIFGGIDLILIADFQVGVSS